MSCSRFQPFLSAFQTAGKHPGFNWHIFFNAEGIHKPAVTKIRSKLSSKLGRTSWSRVTLPLHDPLVINPPRFVALSQLRANPKGRPPRVDG